VSVSWGTSSVSGATLTEYVVTTHLATDINFTSPITDKSVSVTNLNSRTATISGLTNGTAYVVRVVGKVGEVVGTQRSSVSFTPKGVPVTPSAPSASRAESTATLNWNAPNANGAVIDYYEITYATSATGSFTSPNSGTCVGNISGLTCTISGLSEGNTYFFKLRAHNAVGFSSYSLASAGLNYPAAVKNVVTPVVSKAQKAPVSVPKTLKAKKKLKFPVTSKAGTALRVSVKGSCKVAKTFKTVKVKVGKKTKKVKKQTGWTVQALKKNKVCEIRQTAKAGKGFAALKASSKVRIK
jgi:hypothetical protein